jgi:hypothetical protein
MVSALPRAGATAIPPGPPAPVPTQPLPETILASTQPQPVAQPATGTPAAAKVPSNGLDQALDSLLNAPPSQPSRDQTPPFE